MAGRGLIHRGLVLAASLCTLSLTTAAFADDEDRFGADLLPPQTLLYFSVPDVTALQESLGESLAGQLLADEAVQPIREEIEQKLEELSEKLNDEIGLTISDLCNLFSGEVTFAIVEKPTRKLALLMLIDCGDNEATVESLLEKLDGAAVEAGCTKKEVDISGISVTMFDLPVEEEVPFKKMGYFAADGYVVFGSEQAALESVIERWESSDAGTLADDKVYAYISEACRFDDETDPAAEWYVNPIGLTKSAIQMAQGQLPQAGIALGIIPVLGLDKFRAMGGAYTVAAGDFDAYTASLLYVDQPTSGVLNLFQFPPDIQTPPEWVPAEVSMYAAANWDVKGAFDTIQGLLAMFNLSAQFDQALEALKEGDFPIDVEADIIANLNGHFHVYQPDAEVDSENPVPLMVVAVGVQNEENVSKLLAKAAAMEGFEGKQREFGGQTIYEMSSDDSGQTVGVAVTRGHLIMTSQVESLERIIRSTDGEGSLANDPTFKGLADFFPEKTSMISFQRTASSQTRQAWEMMLEQLPEEFPIDLSKLPDYEVLEKYMRPQASYCAPDEHGAKFVGYTLTETVE